MRSYRPSRIRSLASLILAAICLASCGCRKDRRVPFLDSNQTVQDLPKSTKPVTANAYVDGGLALHPVRISRAQSSTWLGLGAGMQIVTDHRHGTLVLNSSETPIPVSLDVLDAGPNAPLFTWDAPVECSQEPISLQVAPEKFAWLKVRWQCTAGDAGRNSSSEEHHWLLDPKTGAIIDEWSISDAKSTEDKIIFEMTTLEDPAYIGVLRIIVRPLFSVSSTETQITWVRFGPGIRREIREPIQKIHDLSGRAEKQLSIRPKNALKAAALTIALYDAVCRQSRRARITFESEIEPGVLCQNTEDIGRALAIGIIASAQNGVSQSNQSWYRRIADPDIKIPEPLRIQMNNVIGDAGMLVPPATAP